MSAGGAGQAAGQCGLSYLMVQCMAACGAVLALYALCLWRLRRERARAQTLGWSRDGAVVLAHWPSGVRNLISLFVFCVIVLPSFMILMSGFFAVVIAPLEGWSLCDAFEYELSNVAELTNPLSNLVPSTSFGMAVDVFVSVLTMLLSNVSMGLAAGLAFMLRVAEGMPASTGGLLKCLLLAFPALMLLMSILFGCALALVEGWRPSDGFLFMASALLGDATGLTSVAPGTSPGVMFTVYAQVIGLTVSGAVVGIIGSHPVATEAIAFLEGRPAGDANSSRASSDGRGSDYLRLACTGAPAVEGASSSDDDPA